MKNRAKIRFCFIILLSVWVFIRVLFFMFVNEWDADDTDDADLHGFFYRCFIREDPPNPRYPRAILEMGR